MKTNLKSNSLKILALTFVMVSFILINNVAALENVGMANPAAIHCIELGYEYKVIKTSMGERGICIFPNSKECDDWEFLEGKCGKEYSYCAKHGYGIKTISDGKNPFSQEYAVCIPKSSAALSESSTGSLIGRKAVTELMGLMDKVSAGAHVSESVDKFEESKVSEERISSPASTPSSFDWRDKDGINWMTSVKNQGGCGSCWAFAAVGGVEANINIEKNDPNFDQDLSEQYLVSDCCSAGDCGGGWSDEALDYVKSDGISDEACYPYTGSDSSCSDRCADWESRLWKIDNYGYMADSAIKDNLIEKGPLPTYLYMDGGFDGDVYKCGDPPFDPYSGHAIVIVGYNDAGNYWIAKNSWGNTWGPASDGYFKIGYGECKINNYYNDPFYIDFDTTPPTTTDDAPTDWQNSDVTVTLTPSDPDPSSDIAFTYYCVDQTGTCTPETHGTSVSVTAEGTNYVRYRSDDNAGNNETIKSTSVRIDKTAPVTTDDAPPVWQNSDVTVTLYPTDDAEGSGAADTYYCVDQEDTCTPTTSGTSVLVSAEGTNYLRYYSEDNAGNSETVKSVEVKIDKTPPTTTDDAPADWQTSDITVTLTPDDSLSGVLNTYYCTDQTDTCTPTTPGTSVVVSTEGLSYVRYYSVDNAGNLETVKSAATKIDRTPPATIDDAPIDWQNSDVTVTLIPSDSGSGVSNTYYCTDQSNTCNPTTSGTSVSVSSEGVNYVRYYSTDNVGNTESIKSTPVMLDKTPPITTDNAPSGWQTSDVTVTLVPSDSEPSSGIANTYYCVDQTDTCSPSTVGNSVLISTEGINYLRYYSEDTAGNSESVKSATVQLDKSAPTTTDDAPADWVNYDVTVTLTPTDTGSGVDETYYCTDQTNTCNPTTSGTSVLVTAEGTNYVRYYSIDNIANSESVKSVQVQLDTAAPETTDDAPDGLVNYDVTVTLTATDAGSGAADTYYCVDQEDTCTPETSGTSVLVADEGTNYLRYYSEDNAGNSETVNSVEVKIDKTPPTISFSAQTSDAEKAQNWIYIKTTAQDSSGISGKLVLEFEGVNTTDWNSCILGDEPQDPISCSINKTNLDDGNYTFIVYANDVAGNTGKSEERWVVLDTTGPEISIIPTNNSALATGTTSTLLKVETNEDAQCKYSNQNGQTFADMSFFNYSNSTTHNITIYNLNNGKSYDYYIKCNDTLGNLNADDYWLHFSVKNPGGEDPKTSGGGGGGGAGGTPLPICTINFGTMKAGSSMTKICENSDKVYVTQMTLSAKNDIKNGIVKVTRFFVKPYILSDPGTAFTYFKIDGLNFKNEDIDKAEVRFKVNKTWISANDLDENEIKLLRDVSGTWTELSTKKVMSTSESSYYSAETPGFSFFTITGKVAEIKEAEVITPKPVEEEKPLTEEEVTEEGGQGPTPFIIFGLKPSTIGTIVGAILIVSIVGYFMYTKKQVVKAHIKKFNKKR